jgi:hypothetical protein
MELDIQSNLTVGKPQLVGILRQIQVINSGFVELHIEQYDTNTEVPRVLGIF